MVVNAVQLAVNWQKSAVGFELMENLTLLKIRILNSEYRILLQFEPQLLRQLPKTEPMVSSNTVFPYGLAVFFGRVPLVVFPVVHRVFVVQFFHVGISICFCQYRGGSNAHILTVAFDDAFMWNFFVGMEPISVYYNEFRFSL